MAYRFATKHWADPLIGVTDSPRFQNAQIRIFDPSVAVLDEPYDIETGEGGNLTGGDVYTGQARIIGVRWGVFHGGESQANASTEKAIRVQIPHVSGGKTLYGEDSPYGDDVYGELGGTFFRVRKGCKLYVTKCERNPTLEELIFVATSDMQGSMTGSRTFEFALDGDVQLPEGD